MGCAVRSVEIAGKKSLSICGGISGNSNGKELKENRRRKRNARGYEDVIFKKCALVLPRH